VQQPVFVEVFVWLLSIDLHGLHFEHEALEVTLSIFYGGGGAGRAWLLHFSLECLLEGNATQ
jgi:hypothetical protein